MFTLLRRTLHGWTDQHGDVSAEFATDAEAREASIDLDEAWGTSSHWLVVPTADLGNYDLVA